MKRTRFIILLTIFFSAYGPLFTYAGIKMEVETSFMPLSDGVEVSLKVSNTGNEDSLVVYPGIRLGRVTKELNQVPYIAFEGSATWKHEFKWEELGLEYEGVHPVFITIYYHDANMYPFSMPYMDDIKYGEVEPPLETESQIQVSDIKLSGTLRLSIKNSLSDDINGICEIFSAKELPVDNPAVPLFVKKDEAKEVAFNIKNAGALSGRIYPVYAVFQFSTGGRHFAQTVTATARVLDPGPDYSYLYQVVGCFIFVGLLFFLTLYFELRNLKKEN